MNSIVIDAILFGIYLIQIVCVNVTSRMITKIAWNKNKRRKYIQMRLYIVVYLIFMGFTVLMEIYMGMILNRYVHFV